MTEFQYRRLPATEKNVADIDPENDIRIRILGRVIGKENEVIVVDDDSGKADIITSDGSPVVSRVRVAPATLKLEAEVESILTTPLISTSNSCPFFQVHSHF